jgi:adenylate cyclase
MSVFTDPEVDAFRSQLHKVLNSADFDASKRNREFLSYVVEEAIAGRAHRIKAYNIATAVFGRDSNFDPQADPVVRIEARRLRRSLEHYYLTAGKKDSLTVSIPKGGYAPSFQTKRADRSDTPVVVRENWRGSETGPDLRAQGPVIFVASFEEEGDQSTFPNFTHGFTRGLIVALTRFNDLVVFGTDTSLAYSSDCSLEQLRTDLGIDFLVRGGTAISSDRFDVEILLIDAQAGRSLWAENFSKDLKPANIVAVRDEVANSIARTLAQPFGVIFSLKAQETEGRPPNDLESYDCVIRYYQYWRSINPHYAEGIACLSQIYTDAYRFGFDSGLDEDDPRDKALALARRAIDLAPSSSRGHHALSLAYRFIGDSLASFNSLQTALNLNPNDTEIMASLGLRHLAHGRYEEALNEARKVTAPRIVYGHVLEAAAAAGLCLSDEAASAITAIRSIDPDYGQHVVSDLQKRSLHPDMIALIVDWLARAGLPGCDTGAQVIPIQKAKRAK